MGRGDLVVTDLVPAVAGVFPTIFVFSTWQAKSYHSR